MVYCTWTYLPNSPFRSCSDEDMIVIGEAKKISMVGKWSSWRGFPTFAASTLLLDSRFQQPKKFNGGRHRWISFSIWYSLQNFFILENSTLTNRIPNIDKTRELPTPLLFFRCPTNKRYGTPCTTRMILRNMTQQETYLQPMCWWNYGHGVENSVFPRTIVLVN